MMVVGGRQAAVPRRLQRASPASTSQQPNMPRAERLVTYMAARGDRRPMRRAPENRSRPLRPWTAALVALGVVCTAAAVAASPTPRRTRATSADSWLRLLAEYAGEAGGAAGDGDWFPRPVPVQLPTGRGGGGVPMLIVPVPVPAPSQCSTSGASSEGAARGRAPPSAELRPTPPPPAPWPELPAAPAPPRLDYIVSSQQLVELYRAQVAPQPELPPALIPEYAADSAFTGAAEAGTARLVRTRRYQLPRSPPAAPPAAAAPSPPLLERSLMLRGELTVPRSGYTEPYTVWWDAATGAARVDLHGGATSTYRAPLSDGRVQGIEFRVDRSGEGEVRRCAVAAPRAPELADRGPPAVPDLNDFSFDGYAEADFGRVERWTRAVSGRGEDVGGAPGEELTFRHEILVARAPNNTTATPLRYSVAVDSSVLGADCDGYVHRYTELREQQHDPALLQLDTAEACEALEEAAPRERVEPLREYTLLRRDPRHDDGFRHFKTEHDRRYLDDVEQAVRKTLLVQHTRFVESGNRQGAPFAMRVNHLGDRLDDELRVQSGAAEAPEGLPAERFPHSSDQLAAARLPRNFDWRERGAVSHVRFQGATCSSCWALAVTGAVEGALFVRTRRLVPLSEQAVVDCARPFGGHGCGRSWPSAAYDYAQERGLPALADYTPYQEKELTCLDSRVPPVTRITSHVNVTRHSVQALKVAIRRHAPSVVIVDATAKSFQFYERGVLYDDRCAKDKPDHAVLAVGWGERRRETHFILKNSWSQKWGEGGYVRVAAASNTCGVLSRASYPRLERDDVLALPAGGV